MRIILVILLFISQCATAQFGNKNFAFRSPITTPTEGFNWNTLQVQAPTTYTSQSNLVIDGKSFTNLNSGVQAGANLKFDNCTNITIRNCYIGSSIGIGIHITGGSNFTIENCFFANNVSGVYVQTAQDVIIQDNQCINPHGPFPRGQFVQFNGVTTSASGQCAVRRNNIENFYAESYAFDIINIHASNGRAGAPIDVSDNLMRGGGPATSGGGILLGEAGGDYNAANNNKLWNPGNYQMALGGGSNNSMTGNMCYSNRMDCSVDNWSNVGYIIWAQLAESLPFDNATFTNNYNYTDCAVPAAASGGFGNNPYYYPTTISGTIDLDPIYWYTQGPELAQFVTLIDFPETIIDFVTEDVLWQIRNESQQFRVDVVVGGQPPWLARPTANAGADQNITISTATLSGAASTSTNGKNYRWIQVSGPNTATMSAPLAVTNNLSGLITGTYRFRLEVLDNNGIGMADWIDVNVTLM